MPMDAAWTRRRVRRRRMGVGRIIAVVLSPAFGGDGIDAS